MSALGTGTAEQSARTALLTVPEVAAIFRVSPRTIRRWASEGRVELIKVGGVARFHREAIEALIANGTDPGNESGPATTPGPNSTAEDTRDAGAQFADRG